MKKNINESKCKHCTHCTVTPDSKWGVRIKCEFNPNKEFLGDFIDEQLCDFCTNYQKDIVVELLDKVGVENGK